jgi:hypothetical protein
MIRREYQAALAMLEADFSGEERDYCCAADDFKRHPPLDVDLTGSPRVAPFGPSGPARLPTYASMQAAGSMSAR